MTVTAVAVGTATVTVTAADPDGLTAAQGAEVTVEAANQAPGAVGTIPAQAMTAGDEVVVDVSPFFSDPDDDELTYTAESSNADVVTASIEGSSLTVTAVATGTATVTVTASDPDGESAAQSAGVTVEAANNAPEAVGAIPPQTMTAGQTVTVDVSSFFSDPDDDDLTYTAESSDAAVVAVSVEGSSVTVTAVAVGTATVTVTAADPDGLTAAQGAEVTVEAANQAPGAVGAIPAQSMTEGDVLTVDVSSFFSAGRGSDRGGGQPGTWGDRGGGGGDSGAVDDRGRRLDRGRVFVLQRSGRGRADVHGGVERRGRGGRQH
ncbi:Ig-like domain-containing protein [Candidatus Palauibacter sp.]|uniref:Ig-like domain-containing protein n=1 Tax=Candidatus Palauibacter sp. TaxID=3101350 RepID=UPI003AF292F1